MCVDNARLSYTYVSLKYRWQSGSEKVNYVYVTSVLKESVVGVKTLMQSKLKKMFLHYARPLCCHTLYLA